MAAVVIVGILAVIAIPAYRSLVSASRNAEAPRVLQAVRVAEERYKTLNHRYAGLSSALGVPSDCSTCYPAPAPATVRRGWGGPCSGCGGAVDWREMDVKVDGPVLFGYTVLQGNVGTVPAPSPLPMRLKQGSVNVSWPTLPGFQTQEWFIMTAVGDVDGDGSACMVMGSSFNTELTFEVDCL
jgi:type II secretory pathway pseudopilin PulG